jgi:hypothetical protein
LKRQKIQGYGDIIDVYVREGDDERVNHYYHKFEGSPKFYDGWLKAKEEYRVD